MDIGVSTACMFGRLHIEDAIREYGRLGIGTTEVFLNTFSEHDPVFIKKLRKTADDSGVKIVSVTGTAWPMSRTCSPDMIGRKRILLTYLSG